MVRTATTKLILALLVVLSAAQHAETRKTTAPQQKDQTGTNPVDQASDHSTNVHHLETAIFDRASTTPSTWLATDPAVEDDTDEVDSGANLGNAFSLSNVLSSISSIGSSVEGVLWLFRTVSTAYERIKEKFAHPIRTALEVAQHLGVSLPDGVSEPCGRHVRLAIDEFLSALLESRNPLFEWSVHMFDAIAKPVPGVMWGAINFPGSFSQCVNIVVGEDGMTGTAGARPGDRGVEFVGEHCIVNIQVPKSIIPQEFQNLSLLSDLWPNANLRYAFCFPSTCNIGDKNKLITSLASKISLEAGVDEKMCRTKISPPMDSAAMWLCIVLIIPVAVVLAGTILDFWRGQSQKKSKGQENTETGEEAYVTQLFLGFSAFRSFERLLAAPEHREGNTFNFIQGMRALSIAWVVYGHTFVATAIPDLPMRELMNALDHLKNWLIANPIFGSLYSMETFFFLSGFSAIYFSLQKKVVHKFTILDFLKMYWNRYYRLTPAMLYVIIFVAGPWRYIWNGPFWSPVVEMSDICRRVWWSDLLYIGNFLIDVKERNAFCQVQFWYLAVDMQLFLLVPPLLFATIRKPKLALPALVILYFAALTIQGILNYENDNPVLSIINIGDISDISKIIKHFKGLKFDLKTSINAYMHPWMRGHTYVLGMIMGLILHRLKDVNVFMKRHVVVFGWITCIAITSVTCSLNFFFNNGYIEPTFGWNYLMGLTTTSVWALAIGWIVFACANGYGGFATKLLSCSLLVVLGRLSYCIFLVHLLVGLSEIASVQAAVALDPISMISLSVTMMVFSIVVATVLYVLIEAPVASIKFGSTDRKKFNGPCNNDHTLLGVPLHNYDVEEMTSLISTDDHSKNGTQ